MFLLTDGQAHTPLVVAVDAEYVILIFVTYGTVGLKSKHIKGGDSNMSEVDLFLRGSGNNDEFARTVRGRNRSDKDTAKIVAKWRSCDHLFVKIRESEYSGSFHSSDCSTTPARYECVRCGLTNRLADMEDTLDRNDCGGILSDRKKVTDETVEWKEETTQSVKKSSPQRRADQYGSSWRSVRDCGRALPCARH